MLHAPGVLEGEGFSPIGDLLLFLSLSPSPSWALLKIKVLECACVRVCVRARALMCEGRMGREGHPEACPGWGLLWEGPGAGRV